MTLKLFLSLMLFPLLSFGQSTEGSSDSGTSADITVVNFSADEEDVIDLGQINRFDENDKNFQCPADTGAPIIPNPAIQDFLSDCFSFRNREPTSDHSFTVYDVSEDYVREDKRICSCYRHTASGKVMTTEQEKKAKDVREDDLKYKIVEANIRQKGRRLQSMYDGMLIQAHMISTTESNEKEANKFMGHYSSAVEPGTRELISDYKLSLAKRAGEFETAENRKAFGKTVHSIGEPVGISESSFPSDEIPKVPEGACFSMKTYLAWEQQPKEKVFRDELKKTTNFVPDDWNLETLKEQYDKAYRVMDDERTSRKERKRLNVRVRTLKAKIAFLRKNPLYANLFGAKGLPAQKQKLLDRLKTHFTQDACSFSEGSCAEKKAKEQASFDRDIRAIFNDPEVWAATKERLNDNIIAEYQDNGEKVMTVKIPGTQPALEAKYLNMYGKSVTLCSTDAILGAASTVASMIRNDCAENFANYCQLVDKSYAGIGNQSMFTRPSDNLEEEMQYDFDLDPNHNPGYLKLTNEICKQKRYHLEHGRMDFAQFKKDTCLKVVGINLSLKAECHNDNLLIAKFIEKYPYSQDSVPNDETTELVKNLASVFGQQPEPGKKKVGKKQVEEITSYTTTVEEIRKHGASKAFARMDSLAQMQVPSDTFSKTPVMKSVVAAPLAPAKGALNDVPLVPVTANAAAAKESPSELPKAVEKVVKEKSGVEGELAKARKELADLKDKKSQDDLDKRIKGLEDQLAAKEAEFQRLMAESKNPKSKKKSASVGADEEAEDAPEGSAEKSGKKQFVAAATAGAKGGEDKGPSRSIASLNPTQVAQDIGAAGGSSKAGANANAAATDRGSRINSALLEKYGISVEGPTDASILLAKEKNAEDIPLLDRDFHGQNVPVEVSSTDYARFKGNDLESLKTIYDKKVKAVKGSVVKLSITTKTEKGALEFYAIREGDKIVFQPVRRVTLSALGDELKAQTKK